jgi:hypothetical protein
VSSRTPNRTRKIVVRVIALMLALLICGVLYDLYFPRTTHLREFDPDEVARLETAMWRSYSTGIHPLSSILRKFLMRNLLNTSFIVFSPCSTSDISCTSRC